jgi:hypothetical protein
MKIGATRGKYDNQSVLLKEIPELKDKFVFQEWLESYQSGCIE